MMSKYPLPFFSLIKQSFWSDTQLTHFFLQNEINCIIKKHHLSKYIADECWIKNGKFAAL